MLSRLSRTLRRLPVRPGLPGVLDHLERRTKGIALTGGGMVVLVTGSKLTAVSMTAQGLRTLEEEWRAQHPDFDGGLAERWRAAVDFYDETHQDPTNRALHMIGIPIIVGGVAGLLIWPRYSPPWLLSAGAYAGGWALNLVGHAVYERNGPAFADDPLALLAGPVWDLARLRERLGGRREAHAS